MKQCPGCRRSYDDSQSFCLMDGTPLVDEPEEPTVVRQPAAVAARKKPKYLLWGALFALSLVAMMGAAFVFLIYKFSDSGDTAKQTNITTPKPTATASKPSPTAAVNVNTANASPTVSPTATNAVNANQNSAQNTAAEESEEAVPIAWDTTATGFNLKEGVSYKFECPPNGEQRIVWGSDVYTQDSSICTAGVHAGIITLESGGTVTIEHRPGRALYGSTERNGIKTRNYGEYPKSFVVR